MSVDGENQDLPEDPKARAVPPRGDVVFEPVIYVDSASGNCLVTRDGISVTRFNAGASRVCINRPSSLKDSPRSSRDIGTGVEQQTSPSNSVLSATPHINMGLDINDQCMQMNPNTQNISSQPSHVNMPNPSPSQASGFSSPGPASRSADSVHGVVTTEVGHSPKNSKFAGITSPQVFAKSIEELIKPVAPHLDVMKFLCPTMTFSEELSLQSIIQKPILDKVTADSCLHSFFNIYHVLLPIFDVKQLRLHYEIFYQADRNLEPADIACVLLAIALGCENPDVADLHFRAAWGLYSDLLAHPYLSSVQAFILMSLYLMNSGRDNQAHLNIGTATRIAQSIGLHRSLSTHNHPHEFGKLSFELGRPSAIRDDDCDADLPDISQALTPSSHALVGSYLTEFFSSFIDLCKRLSKISSDLFSINTPNLDQNTIRTLMANADTLLQDWRASLPEALVPDHDSLHSRGNISTIATSILNCTYFNALVVVHRSSLLCQSRPNNMVHRINRRIAGSDKICLDAAHNLAHETNNLIAEHKVKAIPRWIHPYAINAVMAIFFSLMRSPQKWSRGIDIALLRSMHHCFRNREDTNLLGRFERFLETLIEAIENPRPIENNQSLEQNAVSRTQIHTSPACGTGDWTQAWPDQTSGPLIQCIETDDQDHPIPREENAQLGGIFGDPHNLWDFQLWPLMPFSDDGLSINGEFGQGSTQL
ncbi:hypothetical protein N7541_006818 [Penicillium brevicompactum]|uniref:Xylanolytic transcriptional activator regulatory domain-containing protein n=1 Tax=Penicillium brevicompactum TaxID=5074 RepID=A0A9W9R7R8_PENBR|nr:hypothetical protein N7541_006818 [Penicillium brevicompactum]